MARKMTPEGRIRCAVHAVSELLTWEYPTNIPDDVEWIPPLQLVAAKTSALYSWVEITPEEAAAAVQQVLDERAEEQSRRDAARWTPQEAEV